MIMFITNCKILRFIITITASVTIQHLQYAFTIIITDGALQSLTAVLSADNK